MTNEMLVAIIAAIVGWILFVVMAFLCTAYKAWTEELRQQIADLNRQLEYKENELANERRAAAENRQLVENIKLLMRFPEDE